MGCICSYTNVNDYVQKTLHELEGDFFDFDRLYFPIFRLTGNFGNSPWKPSEGYDEVCEYILALCYELRHAWQGDRDLIGTFNGLSRSWFESHSYSENDDGCDVDDDCDVDDGEYTEVDDDDDSQKNDEKIRNSCNCTDRPLAGRAARGI